MISGPIIPRTHESLWELVHQDPGLIERGLQIVRDSIVLDDGIVIDALACDASGVPVLVFGSATEDARHLTSRIRDAHEWFVANWRVLASALPQCAVRLNEAPRLLVVGFEFSETCLERLRDPVFAAIDLSVFRFEGVFMDGQRHIGVTPMFGKALDEIGSFTVPAGIRDASLRARSGQFLDVMERLDPGLRAEGDRFSRRFFTAAGMLSELEFRCDTLVVSIAGASPHGIVTEIDVDVVADLVLRRYLEVQVGSVPRVAMPLVNMPRDQLPRDQLPRDQLPRDQLARDGGPEPRLPGWQRQPTEVALLPEAAPLNLDAGLNQPHDAGQMPPGDDGRLTLGTLRERMQRAQVSNEEFDAICDVERREEE